LIVKTTLRGTQLKFHQKVSVKSHSKQIILIKFKYNKSTTMIKKITYLVIISILMTSCVVSGNNCKEMTANFKILSAEKDLIESEVSELIKRYDNLIGKNEKLETDLIEQKELVVQLLVYYTFLLRYFKSV